MKREKLAAVFFAAVIVLGLAASADAVDGTIEINQATVLASGGFPYHIPASGSYRLTGNLTVPAGSSGILVNAPGVTIDLNGFAIVGGFTASTFGISVTTSPRFDDTLVENGIVSSFGTGISLNDYSVVKSVDADTNLNVGIAVSAFGLVEGSRANGITSGSGIGISCAGGCNISGNVATNDNVGISAGGQALILHNIVASCNNFGLSITGTFPATTGYGENVLTSNAKDVSGGTSMKNNVCDGTLC